MKKFVLVLFIGIVLAINLYGIVMDIMTEDIHEIDHIKETTTVVYME